MNISRNDIQNWVPTIWEISSISRAVTFFRPKGGVGLFFFAYTPDIQYFKGRLPPGLTVPLRSSVGDSTDHGLWFWNIVFITICPAEANLSLLDIILLPSYSVYI